MYGLAMNVVRDYLVKNHGEGVWSKILKEVPEIPKEGIISSEHYSDEVMGKLLGAASGLTQQSPPQILEGCGRIWIDFLADNGFLSFIEANGPTFIQLFKNLNSMHTQILANMPKLIAPEFYVSDESDQGFRLKYLSKRPMPQTPLVFGAIHGIAKRYGIAVEVKIEATRMQGAECDVFWIQTKVPG